MANNRLGAVCAICAAALVHGVAFGGAVADGTDFIVSADAGETYTHDSAVGNYARLVKRGAGEVVLTKTSSGFSGSLVRLADSALSVPLPDAAAILLVATTASRTIRTKAAITPSATNRSCRSFNLLLISIIPSSLPFNLKQTCCHHKAPRLIQTHPLRKLQGRFRPPGSSDPMFPAGFPGQDKQLYRLPGLPVYLLCSRRNPRTSHFQNLYP